MCPTLLTRTRPNSNMAYPNPSLDFKGDYHLPHYTTYTIYQLHYRNSVVTSYIYSAYRIESHTWK